jgi:hypothetical protein
MRRKRVASIGGPATRPLTIPDSCQRRRFSAATPFGSSGPVLGCSLLRRRTVSDRGARSRPGEPGTRCAEDVVSGCYLASPGAAGGSGRSPGRSFYPGCPAPASHGGGRESALATPAAFEVGRSIRWRHSKTKHPGGVLPSRPGVPGPAVGAGQHQRGAVREPAALAAGHASRDGALCTVSGPRQVLRFAGGEGLAAPASGV